MGDLRPFSCGTGSLTLKNAVSSAPPRPTWKYAHTSQGVSMEHIDLSSLLIEIYQPNRGIHHNFNIPCFTQKLVYDDLGM